MASVQRDLIYHRETILPPEKQIRVSATPAAKPRSSGQTLIVISTPVPPISLLKSCVSWNSAKQTHTQCISI